MINNLAKNISVSLFFGLFVLLATGCVTQKKYDELKAQKENLATENQELTDNLEIARKKVDQLEKQVAALKNDTSQQQQKLAQIQKSLDSLKIEYDKLETYYNNLQANKGKLNQDIASQQKRLMAMEADLEIAKKQNEELRQNLKKREARVEELEKILDEKEQAVNKLRNQVSQALLNFDKGDLSVEIKNGKVYVSMTEQLLFGSGSVAIDENGKKALRQLAEVLKQQEGVNIMVEGHTDDVPVSKISKYMQDNWDLSVMRATRVVRILTNAGVQPDRIIAAGRGEHHPLTSNETAEGRQKNRRTEIILTPELDELFQILESS